MAAQVEVEIEVVIETPRDSRNKYEVDAQGVVRFDRPAGRVRLSR